VSREEQPALAVSIIDVSCNKWSGNLTKGRIAPTSTVVRILYNGPPTPQKLPSRGDLDPQLIGLHGSFGPSESMHPERHLNRFSRFCKAHDRDGQTDRRTDQVTPCATKGRIYAALRCGLRMLRRHCVLQESVAEFSLRFGEQCGS